MLMIVSGQKRMSNIFITGGSRGIGYQLVKQYASIKGNTVVTTTRNIEKSVELTKLAKELGNIKILALEISSQESIDALEKALPQAIPNGIDVFIANAAIGNARFRILDAPREVYQSHYDTNVLGTIFVTKIVYPYLLKRQTRKIVIISSLVGQITEYFPGSTVSAYGQSKAAINYTAKALSSELADEGFIVIPIHPGVVVTDLLEHLLEGESDIAKYLRTIALTPEVSAAGIISVTEGLTKEDSGTFYDYEKNALTY